MRCFPAAVLCLFFFASVSRANVPVSLTLPVTVRDSRGLPLVGVWLTLQPLGRIVMTSGKGVAAFTGLPPGSYTVSLSPPGYYPLSLPITLAADAQSGMEFTLNKNGAYSVNKKDAVGEHYQITLPPVPRPVNPPPEYLLTPPVPLGSGPAWRTAQENVLREAMFRYLFNDARLNDTQHYLVYYLSVQGFPWEEGLEGAKDPDKALLERLDGSQPPVKPVSALLTEHKDWRKYPRHNWIIYCVSSFRWISDTEVEINASKSLSGCFGGESIRLTCTLRNGWWQITGATEVSA